jgi:hypothetical protein
MKRCKERGIRGRKVLSHIFTGTNHKQINKDSQPKMIPRWQIHLEKFQGNNMYNVWDAKENTFIGIVLTKEKE